MIWAGETDLMGIYAYQGTWFPDDDMVVDSHDHEDAWWTDGISKSLPCPGVISISRMNLAPIIDVTHLVSLSLVGGDVDASNRARNIGAQCRQFPSTSGRGAGSVRQPPSGSEARDPPYYCRPRISPLAWKPGMIVHDTPCPIDSSLYRISTPCYSDVLRTWFVVQCAS